MKKVLKSKLMGFIVYQSNVHNSMADSLGVAQFGKDSKALRKSLIEEKALILDENLSLEDARRIVAESIQPLLRIRRSSTVETTFWY